MHPPCHECGGVVKPHEGGVCKACFYENYSDEAIVAKALEIIRGTPKKERNELLRRMHRAGFTPTELAKVSGLHRVYLYEILKD